MCTSWLPDEVWTLLFIYLPLSDRLTVRLTCKYFRDLVDNSDLWKDWILELKRSGEDYEEHFWHMLRRWRVTSAQVFSLDSWTHITKELPGLTTLIINKRHFTETLDFRSFINLQRLYLTYLTSSIDLDAFCLLMPQRLTHLSICNDLFDRNALPTEIHPESPLKNLKSFGFHCFFSSHPVEVLHFFLSTLPQLRHLSLSAFTQTPYEGNMSDLPPVNNCSLSSLKLVSCLPRYLPTDLVKMLKPLPFLRSFAILCLSNNDKDVDLLKLSTWLKDLPALTSLVVKGGEVMKFVGSIPRGLTRLTLLPKKINPEDMAALSTQLPNVRHLHLEPLYEFLDSGMALIPQYFPRLKTLRILFKSRVPEEWPDEQVPDDAFLSLALLKELEVLEIQNEELPPAELISKLRELTNSRVRIYCRTEEDRLRSCNCAYQISQDCWM